MRWSSSPSPEAEPDAAAADFTRRLVEASQRAEIVALLNSARSEHEVARIATHRVCEALDAEIAFVVAARDGRAVPVLVASTGLTPAQAAAAADERLCADAASAGHATAHRDVAFGGAGIRRLVLCPWTCESSGYVVLGVGRQYDEDFTPREVALVD